MRAGKRKRFTDKRALSEKKSEKSERGPEDVGAAIVYRRDLLVPSRDSDSDVKDPGSAVDTPDCGVGRFKSTERIQKKKTKKGKGSVGVQEGEEQELETTVIKESVKGAESGPYDL